jgi:hypothetical protein
MTAFVSHELIGVGILYALIVIAIMVAVWAVVTRLVDKNDRNGPDIKTKMVRRHDWGAIRRTKHIPFFLVGDDRDTG